MIPESLVNYFKFALFEIGQAVASNECAARTSIKPGDRAWHSEQLKALHRAEKYIKQGLEGTDGETTDSCTTV